MVDLVFGRVFPDCHAPQRGSVRVWLRHTWEKWTDVYACQVRERELQVRQFRSGQQRAHGNDRRRSLVSVYAYTRLPAKKWTTNAFTFQVRERELQVK